jgi:hypothetical protein
VLAFEHLQAEFGDHPYDYAETPWRITCADPARQAKVDALLADLPAAACAADSEGGRSAGG